MQYICVTHVDAGTGVPCFKQPMRVGPKFPDIKGLDVQWWDQSRWPIVDQDDFPKFYGTCDDDADLSVPGVIDTMSQAKFNELKEYELQARLPKEATPRAIRLALLEMGILDQVETYLNNLTEPAKSKAKISWEYATMIYKTDPIVQTMGATLGFTEAQIDDIFVLAQSKLTDDPFASDE